MPTSASVEQQIQIVFGHLDRKAASAFPASGFLASELNKQLAQSRKAGNSTISIPPDSAAHFASAAVEMWLRSVHSFLMSVSVSETSHIWASVSGYYASHYTVRGLAHLLGFFLMHQQKHIASIEITGGRSYCSFVRSMDQNREHLYYWKLVKSHPLFQDDPIFTLNNDEDLVSDVAHRNIANYFDHLNNFQQFQVLDEDQVTARVEFLSKIEISSAPIPRPDRYPDLDHVQLIAYHRLIKFRTFLNNVLGDDSNFWRVHRNPTWCPRVIDYQIVESRFIAA